MKKIVKDGPKDEGVRYLVDIQPLEIIGVPRRSFEISPQLARLCVSASARQASLVSPSEAKSGGAEEARTPDLQSAILALSQLSYCPISISDQ